MDNNEEIRDAYTAKISLLWAALSIEWIGVIDNLQPTWSSLLALLLSIFAIAVVGFCILQFFAKKYDILYLKCHYDVRKKSVRGGFVIGIIIYIIGIAFMYSTGVGVPIVYSSIAVAAGLSKAYKTVKTNAAQNYE